MDFEKFLRKTVCQLKVFNNNKVSKMNHFTNQKKMTIFFLTIYKIIPKLKQNMNIVVFNAWLRACFIISENDVVLKWLINRPPNEQKGVISTLAISAALFATQTYKDTLLSKCQNLWGPDRPLTISKVRVSVWLSSREARFCSLLFWFPRATRKCGSGNEMILTVTVRHIWLVRII